MATAPPAIPILSSIAALAETADAWISDIWGVLHNGVVAFPEAAAACVRFREQGGTVVLVTNAPRPKAEVAAMLERLGVPAQAYDEILTSGDLSRSLLAEHRGKQVFHLGPERRDGVLEGLEVARSGASAADVVLCTGLVDDEREGPADYLDMLQALAARQVPMICANPDIMVERGERLVPCAGALAEIYERLGGAVHYAGKPHLPVYERAMAAIAQARGAELPAGRILAIGDGIKTDIAGAGRAGLRSVFIASALHVEAGRQFDAGVLSNLFAGNPHPPVAAMRALAW